MNQRRLIADLHLHSRFARATSRNLNLTTLAGAARTKGIDLLAAPDFTHPVWLDEMRRDLEDGGDGVYQAHGARFLLSTELSCVWTQSGRGRRVHILVMAPDLPAVDRLNTRLARSARLDSDGRPTLRLSARNLALTAWDADPRFLIVPAHVWTPWFGLYGSKSGFDSLEECFGDVSARIRAVETGLSSDPPMNWGVQDLDGRSIVSFSDAHSPATMGRELTVFDAEPTFASVASAMGEGRIVETVEFHPEHGKYHLDGHRKCGVRLTPAESAERHGVCPVCMRELTLGVLNRVQELSAEPDVPAHRENGLIRGPSNRPPFRSLVPLTELLSQALGVGPGSKRLRQAYASLVNELGGELHVLTKVPGPDIERVTEPRIAEAVLAARSGRVTVEPGYDGVYGIVKVPLPELAPQP